MQTLKPAHEVMLRRITALTETIQGLESMKKDGGTTTAGGKIHVSVPELHMMNSQQIGGLCNLLDVLQEMFIPPNALEEVIAGLKSLTYGHTLIAQVIQSLEQRQEKPATAT